MEKELQAELYRLGAQIRAVETILIHVVEALVERGIVERELIEGALDSAIKTTEDISMGRGAIHDVQASRVIEIIGDVKRILKIE